MSARDRGHAPKRPEGLEIRGMDGQSVADISLEKAREVRKKMDDAGLVIWSMGSPIGKFRSRKRIFLRIWRNCAMCWNWPACDALKKLL